MLVLFDIDGTLLLTQGAGIKAMRDAGRELFGAHFTVEGVEFSGRLDPLIWQDLAVLNSVHDPQAHHESFRAAYGRHLQRLLSSNGGARALPGVAQLVQALADLQNVTLGLLTGNYPETGRLKIASAGIDPKLFQVVAWGCDAPTRRQLTPHAIAAHRKLMKRQIEPDEVVIIGDTPHDVDCAKSHGCRAIGVATGLFSAEALRDCGADLAVDDLSQTQMLLPWILQDLAAIPR